MLGECHAHIAMDGVDFIKAMSHHRECVDDAIIHRHLQAYRDRGITFIRDGGDAYGVSLRACDLAPLYGIDYRSPVFAIHRNGHYGRIVGRGFDTMEEYAGLVAEAKRLGADFIKIMTTGIMDFNVYGRITGDDLPGAEVREMVHIAHEEGLAVMSHTNGERPVLLAVEAGVDSVEHGNYLAEESIAALADARVILVPTMTVAYNLIGDGRFDDDVLRSVFERSCLTVGAAYDAGVLLALGSDAGAVGVLHGQGTMDEYGCFKRALPDALDLDDRLAQGQRQIRETFKRVEA